MHITQVWIGLTALSTHIQFHQEENYVDNMSDSHNISYYSYSVMQSHS